MLDTLGLSTWLNALIKPPTPTAPAAPPPVAPPTPVSEGLLAQAASGPHPNLLALYDRARARETALVHERLAFEPRLMAALGVFGLTLAGATVAMGHLAWGLTQWHSPGAIAAVALPNLAATALALRWAWLARSAITELLAERKQPFAGHQALVDPLACLDQAPDGWLTRLIHEVHAANNAQDLSLRKQHERFGGLVRHLTRLAVLLAVQAGYNVALQGPATALPQPAAPAATATPAPTPTPMAKPSPSPRAVAPVRSAATPAPLPSPTPTPLPPRRPAVAPIRPSTPPPAPSPSPLPSEAPPATPAPTPTPRPTATPKPSPAASAAPAAAPVKQPPAPQEKPTPAPTE